MITTLDLPDDLLHELKLRAEHDGRPVKDIVADLLAAGLTPASEARPQNGPVTSKNLPLIKLRPAPPADARQLTTQEWCDWIKDVDLQLEVERYEKAFGHQLSRPSGAPAAEEPAATRTLWLRLRGQSPAGSERLDGCVSRCFRHRT